jgi:hypothetical protein
MNADNASGMRRHRDRFSVSRHGRVERFVLRCVRGTRAALRSKQLLDKTARGCNTGLLTKPRRKQ